MVEGELAVILKEEGRELGRTWAGVLPRPLLVMLAAEMQDRRTETTERLRNCMMDLSLA